MPVRIESLAAIDHVVPIETRAHHGQVLVGHSEMLGVAMVPTAHYGVAWVPTHELGHLGGGHTDFGHHQLGLQLEGHADFGHNQLGAQHHQFGHRSLGGVQHQRFGHHSLGGMQHTLLRPRTGYTGFRG